jgi:hypothetical protein
MENSEIKSSSEPGVNQLQEQVDSLRHVVVSLLILAIVISGTFTVFLLRQYKSVRMEATSLQAAVNEYTTVNLPVISDFRDRLIEYSKTHPEFAPIAQKYGFIVGPGSVTPKMPGAGAPMPSVAPTGAAKQKK